MKNLVPPQSSTFSENHHSIIQQSCSAETYQPMYQQTQHQQILRMNEFDAMKKYNMFPACMQGNIQKDFQQQKPTYDKIFQGSKPLKNLLNISEKTPIEETQSFPERNVPHNRYFPMLQNQLNNTCPDEILQELLRLKTENMDIRTRLFGKGDLNNVGILVTVEDGMIVSANNFFLV